MSNLFDRKIKGLFSMHTKMWFWEFIKILNLFYYPAAWLKCRLAGNKKIVINLGCGGRYDKALFNIDGNPLRKKDLWLDITNPWPLPANRYKGIFASHIFEHFWEDDLKNVLKKCLKALQPGAWFLLLLPNLDFEVEEYLNNKQQNPLEAGRIFSNNILWHGAHHQVFNADLLKSSLQEVGFINMEIKKPEDIKEINNIQLQDLCHVPERSIIMMCNKATE